MRYETQFNVGDHVIVTHKAKKIFPDCIEKIRKFYGYPSEFIEHKFKADIVRVSINDPGYFSNGQSITYYTTPSTCPLCTCRTNLWRESDLKKEGN